MKKRVPFVSLILGAALSFAFPPHRSFIMSHRPLTIGQKSPVVPDDFLADMNSGH